MLLFSAELRGDYPNTVADNLRSLLATIRFDALGSLLGLADGTWTIQQHRRTNASDVDSLRLELEMQASRLVDGVHELFRP